MAYRQAAQTRARRTRSTILAALLLVTAVAVGVVAVSPIDVLHDDASPTVRRGAAETTTDQPATEIPPLHARHDRPERRDQARSLVDTGALRGGVTVFDDQSPTVANLDPALLGALRQAAADAGDDGVEFRVNSGWRSAAYQEQLLREAIAEYGSEAEAARWVATPETSAHVSGDAVDLGPSDAATWLSEHGSGYGLCQIYRNEPWHFELRPGAVDHGCPAMYTDPTQDPRMQQ